MLPSDEASQPTIHPFLPIHSETPRIRVKQIEQNRMLGQHSSHAHGHAFWEIIYCEQSGGVHDLGHQRWEVQAGDLFLVAPFDFHDPDIQAKRWIVQFTPDAIAPLSEPADLNWYWQNPLLQFYRAQVPSCHFNLVEDTRALVVHLLQALETELRLKQLGYKAAVRAYLTLLMIELSRLLVQIAPQRFTPHACLTEVFRIIETQYSEALSVKDIAQAVKRSPTYLTTLFRRLTGRTVLEWVTERRMAEARRLLLQTDENLATICTRIGYTDTNSFIRLFRRLHGVTPGEWRRINCE
jgi:AraC-like DNA-binding protein